MDREIDEASYNEHMRALVEEITSAFSGVSREDGITIHETVLLDDYGVDLEYDSPLRVAARKEDCEHRWQDIPDEVIARPDLSLYFLDAKGFHYYIPAYMIWTLKNLKTCPDHIFTAAHALILPNPKTKFGQETLNLFELFTKEQARATCKFLRFLSEQGDEFEADQAQEALDKYWGTHG